MLRDDAAAGSTTADDSDRRMQILEAANECFTQLGIARTSVQDVAKMANVSRGTVYRYFEDRGVLIEAAVEFGAQQYYRDAAAAMEQVSTLAEQVGAMAEVVTRMNLEHRTRNRLMADDAELMQHIIHDAGATVRRTAHFLLPYVLRARDRGEVGKTVDAELASEWLARLIYSLLAVQSASMVDLSDPGTARMFLTTFAVDGLR